MDYRISMIPYANMAPFRMLGAPSGVQFVSGVPRQSTRSLIEGEVWAACAPIADLPTLGNLVVPLKSYGIAAEGAVKSVFLFSDRPFDEMNNDTVIHLTDHSSSSVRLLYLLLGDQLGYDNLPRQSGQLDGANGELIIGDRALMEVHRPDSRWTHKIDLADLWRQRQGVPFVFARWVVRRDAPDELILILENWLESFGAREQELVEACVPAESERLGLPEAVVREYLTAIHWRLWERELHGMDLFLTKLAEKQRLPLFMSA